MPSYPKLPRVLLVQRDAECLLRCADAIEDDARLALVAAVSNGAAAVAMMAHCRADVVVVDLALADLPALDVVRHAAWHFPQADIVVLAQYGDDERVLACIEAGATAYLLKDQVADSLVFSIHAWRSGQASISQGMARRVLGRLHLQPYRHGPVAHESTGPLSACEAGLLRWIARGMSLEQIGPLVVGSQHSVQSHVKQIYRKLAARAQGRTA
jgi:DNA-binding NarL/FixJ family response regulator